MCSRPKVSRSGPNYSGKYLGDAAFVPVFEELNRRKAVVYTHPTGSTCCVDMIKGVSEGPIEYGHRNHPHDRQPALRRWRDRGALPGHPLHLVAQRRHDAVPDQPVRAADESETRPRLPNGPVPLLQKFYYEVAQGNTPGQLAALLKLVPISQVMFGSDYPYRPGVEAVDGVDAYPFTEPNAAPSIPRTRSA